MNAQPPADSLTPAPELTELFARQHAASRSRPAPSLAERRAALNRLARLVLAERGAIAAAISRDFGNRSTHETELLEIVPLIRGIHATRNRLGQWMKPERRHVSWVFQPARAEVRHEPLGVVGVISPWNYPLLLTLAPLADALGAGNRVMLKPSDLSPAFGAWLHGAMAALFDDDQVAVVTGDAEVARAFSSLPFDHLMFTGSTATGRAVMRAAADNLTPVTLELGGKSPAIVAQDYDLARAARSIGFGKFVNAGQTCIAPDYALVPRALVRDFAEAVLANARAAYPRIGDNPDYSAIISERHHRRLRAAIDEARGAGATVLSTGEAQEGKIPPTVVIGAPDDGLLMREEIFGPVLPVVGYDRIEDALAIVNGRDRPLALYLFTHDSRLQRHVLDGATSGGVTVNGTLLHVAQDDLPFGGVGPSGIGSYHGREGFRRFSHARAVHKIGPINGFEMIGPPWDGLRGSLAGLAARLLAR